MMLGLAAVPSIIQLVGMIYMPESQKWLLKHGNEQQSLRVLNKVYESQDVGKEYHLLHKEMIGEQDISLSKRLKELFTKYRRCLLIGCMLQFFQ